MHNWCTDTACRGATCCTALGLHHLCCADGCFHEADSPSSMGFALTFPKTVASTLSYACAQAVESLMGAVDGSMLERLAKIMAYMRPAQAGAKPGRRLKRKDKLSMLGEAAAPPLNGGALRGSLRPEGPVRCCSQMHPSNMAAHAAHCCL